MPLISFHGMAGYFARLSSLSFDAASPTIMRLYATDSWCATVASKSSRERPRTRSDARRAYVSMSWMYAASDFFGIFDDQVRLDRRPVRLADAPHHFNFPSIEDLRKFAFSAEER